MVGRPYFTTLVFIKIEYIILNLKGTKFR